MLDLQGGDSNPTADPANGIPVATPQDIIQTHNGVSASSHRWWTVWLAAGGLILATVAVYSNSFSGAYIFDDEPSILENPTIRQLWPLSGPLTPPGDGSTVAGRPLLNLSLAVNHAIGDWDVTGYHITNLVIHLLGSLILFGILRRTFLLPSMRERWGRGATPLAFALALFWAIHPLNTESVTYIVQRAESLVGLFYLLTLYCVIRAATAGCATSGSPRPAATFATAGWSVAAVFACLLGMASKEVMVSAPLIVFLYDRAFLAGSFREALRRRWLLYAAFACTWLLLAWLVLSTHNRGGTAGFSTGLSPLAYLCTQFVAIVRYLRLAVWPSHLTFDYGEVTIRSNMQLLRYAAIVVLLGIATLFALWRWPKAGLLGAWFFAILAPTSSIVPVATQTIAEHRTYLPLIAIVIAVSMAIVAAGRSLVGRGLLASRMASIIGCVLAGAVCLIFGLLTWQRNFDYQSPLTIWRDTAAKAPYSGRAHSNYGRFLTNAGQYPEAEAECRRAIEIEPDRSRHHINLSTALFYQKRFDEAAAQCEKAIELESNVVGYHRNLGNALLYGGRAREAVAAYRKALELDDSDAANYTDLGQALASCGENDEAAALFRKAIAIDPRSHIAHNCLGTVLLRQGQVDEAIVHFQKAVEIRPGWDEGNRNLISSLVDRGRQDEAISCLEKLLEVNPKNAQAFDTLQRVRSEREQSRRDINRRRALIQSRPKDAALLNNTAWTLATNPNASLRNGAEAVALAKQAVELTGGQEPGVLGTLAVAYAETGAFAEAIQTTEKAIELAKQKNKQALVESLQAKLPLYNKQLPFREAPAQRK